MASNPELIEENMAILAQWKSSIEVELLKVASAAASESQRLQDGVRYVLEGQGKRLRGLLVMALARDLGGCGPETSGALHAAVSVEMLHAASLVHDDLPALDNDDLRRGRPSCHRAFSEATAILVGDLLVGRAIGWIGEGPATSERQLLIVKMLGRSWGDLCVGQHLDIEKSSDRKVIKRLMELKTGALFGASAYAGCVCAGLSPTLASEFFAWGVEIGVLFQKLDDVSDGDGTMSEPFDREREIFESHARLLKHASPRALPLTELVYRKIVGVSE
jgi:geranylgeranyl pyrophosphate synthase